MKIQKYSRYCLLTLVTAVVSLTSCSTPQITSSQNGCRTDKHGSRAPLGMCTAQDNNPQDFRAALPVTNYTGNHRDKPIAAGYRSLRWPDGHAVTVGFMNDPYHLQDKVLLIANEWHTRGHANITFIKTSNVTEADVRVSFLGTGYWSYLGTQSKTQPHNEQSLNLQFGPQERETEIRRVVLHEFGHALGLVHEHQQPLASIPWNKTEVYKFFGAPPNCWSNADIDQQVLNKLPATPDLPATAFDRDSIMEYPVAEQLTTNHLKIGWNSDLSPTDIEFIAKFYPESSGTAGKSPNKLIDRYAQH